MRGVRESLVVAFLCLSLVLSVGNLAGLSRPSSESVFVNQSFDRLRQFALEDGAPAFEKYYGYTETPAYEPLEVHASDDPNFDYMAASPYYKVYFKGTMVRMSVGDAWIEFDLPHQVMGDILNAETVIDKNSLSVSGVFDSVDLSYELESSVIREAFTLKRLKSAGRLIHKISWQGMKPTVEENGSILFLSENDKEILRILPPFMKDAKGAECTDLHYELAETETGYELHKVIDEKGLEWLSKAVYPVVIDPSIQTLEDAWKSSGITPFGQYFHNLKEYVNPANGHLTITQTDLTVPGRGLDLVISRVYEMPAVFYGENPYGGDYEAPPVNVGKGWQLDFPYVGSKYLHLWGGSIYKIEWSGTTFENHKGIHFKLVKNGDNTYTLTAVNGSVYEFNTSGKITHIKDVDQNTITFNYTSGVLTSITDTIGRTASLSYSSNRLWKITYNSSEIEFGYDANGCLIWMDDFLNRRTSYVYNTGYNNWLLSKITYVTTGYTTYEYNRFSDSNYYKYYVTTQKVYETDQVRHAAYSYTGSFEGITSCTTTVKNGSDATQGSYYFTVNGDGLITQQVIKNASGTPIRKYAYTYNSNKDSTQIDVYNDGSTLSYTNYYSYDNWGNVIYVKNAKGHEMFFSYANTNTAGFFVDNSGTIIKTFTNAFSNTTVPSSVHDVLLGLAEKQDSTYVKEIYISYDSEAHPTEAKFLFGNPTTWLTFNGTFNEKTGDTSFPIDLTGHTTAGNGVLQITGLQSDDTYQEIKSINCHCFPKTCLWKSQGSGWQNNYYRVHWFCCLYVMDCDEDYESIGPFTHYPGTLGYTGYSTNPALDQTSQTFAVTTNWKAYPNQVQYKMNSSSWTTVTSNLGNSTAEVTATGFTDNSSNTLYFSESSAQDTKFSWTLHVPVDNSPTEYTNSMQYDTYGNMISVTDAESNSISLTYSSTYSYAYLTEVTATVGTDTITTKATYDSNRGWITSSQEPKGVDAESGYDYLYTYDVLGRIIKKEFPLLSGQSQRSYMEFVYDCENRRVTIIDQLRHYVVQQYDKLGRLTDVKAYTGTYGSGSLYATISCTYRYDSLIATETDPGNHTTTYAYDFMGRNTQIQLPDSSTISYSYDDTNNKMTLTSGRGYDRIYWFDWIGQLTKVEEEYATDTFTVTTYQYDEIGNPVSFTDAENHTTSYTHASLFGLTKITYPDSTYEEYEYDSVGNLITFTDANGNDVTYTYDAVYRLVEIEYEDQSTVSLTYDLNSNKTRMDDDVPSTGDYAEYSYDNWNRLISETRHISQDALALSFEYDVASRLTKLTYPDNAQILYTYDDLGRTTEIKRYVDGANDEILMDGTQYSTESFLTQFDYGNDLRATYSYDSRDRPSAFEVKNGATYYVDLDYTWDDDNNITQLVNGWRDTDTDWNSDTESYSYDGLDRLTSASCTSWSHTYSYDKVGNRTAKGSVTYTINSVNEVTALSDGTSFTYDSNGNRTQKTKGTDTWDYTYDYANRLIEVEKNDATIGEYVYDGDSKRIQVTEGSETTTYIYMGTSVLYEENSTGSAIYVYGPTGRLAKRSTIQQESTTFYYHTDHLGSTRLVTDEDKNIVTAATYHPFGETCDEEGSEDYLFTGKERDETGLYYYGARYYDPELGRFLTRDPLMGGKGNPQSLNRYTYCVSNPVKLVDPTGLAYKMCNVDTGECTVYSEFGVDGYRVYDADGNLIFSSAEVQAKLDAGDYVGAVQLILEYLGYEVNPENVTIYLDENGVQIGGEIIISVDGEEVTVKVYGPEIVDALEKQNGVDQWPYLGLCTYPRIEGKGPITVYIFIFDDFNRTAEQLYHTVGHELEHAHHAASGQYYDWVEEMGEAGASYWTEYLAYKWNVEHLHIASWFGARRFYEYGMNYYYTKWLEEVRGII